MNPYVVGWAFILVWRLWGLHHLRNVARFHGDEWCFDTPVGRDFYTNGAGLGLLRAFRTRLTMAFAAELLVAVAVLSFAGPMWAFWAFAAVSAPDAFYTTITVKRFAREAWKHALPDGTPPPPRHAAADLAPHTARDYHSPLWLWTLRAATAAALVMLAVDWVRSTRPIGWASVPAIVLYAQAGLLLIRRSLAEWRVCGIPASCAGLALEWRRESRAFHIFLFEILRTWMVFLLLVWAVQATFPQAHPALHIFRRYLVFPLVALTIVFLLGRMRRFTETARRLRGTSSPPPDTELPGSCFHLGGLVYYDPEQPAMFVRRRNFYAINLAHPRSQLSVAYLGGWLLLIGAAWRMS